ncbi:GTPase HflX [Haladaptatus halobius]|uniref:GTPase HflX n=1 Tax=Haladaptatus halobius TaxID=2884875 RepID=UPI001D09C83C|nr:GTPase HflX [Haladaptatus halobius]
MKAILAKRVDSGTADTAELRDLTRAAGYDIAAEFTQSREEDAAFQLGEGKVTELAGTVAETGTELVVFDNQLGPYQTYNLGQRLPEGTRVIDRFRLILEIFGQRAQTRKAQLQVELAELRYELPRVEAKTSLAKRDERPGFMGLGEYDESHEQDIKDQISRIKNELDAIADKEADRRQKRRESGFDLVALAGYTNAGKSTLLQQLAEELEIGENDDLHPDLDTTAEAEDRLFTTLGTTTRKAAIDRRDVLVTDTVGFIQDLPHWLVESFKSTLDAVYYADLVLLVVDVSEPVDEIRNKLVTCHDTLYERNQAPIVTVLNKIDAVSDEELEEKRTALSALAPNPVAISGMEGSNVETLKRRIDAELPDWEFERLVMPMTEDTMSVVSWVHDHARVEDVTYLEDEVVVEFEARPSIVQRSRAKASDLTAAPSA